MACASSHAGASRAAPPATTGTTGAASATAHAGGLTVTVSASPARPAGGQPVQVVVSASDAVAHGVLAYQVAFGDGSATHDVTPMLCTAAAAPQHRTWTATHTYGSRGAYTVSATVSANCTPDRATASVPVRVP